MNDVLQEIFVKGNLSWGNIAVLVVILIGIWGLIFLKGKWARSGQKAQAIDEIKAMPFFSTGIIDLPTATGSIPAKISHIEDDSLVVLKSQGVNHYIPVFQFSSGNLGNRFSVHNESGD
jgi:hypothetical protein